MLYGFSIAYLIAPGTFDSAHVVELVAGLPDTVKYAGKAILAAPFAFHSFNGLRHLSWDMGKCEHLLAASPHHILMSPKSLLLKVHILLVTQSLGQLLFQLSY